jgi:ParB family chromosome partitioning protein
MSVNLIHKNKCVEETAVVWISITSVKPNRSQPRRHFESQELTALAKSISQFGIIQPLCVRKIDDEYELISGERRLRAAKLAGFKTVPCIIHEADNERSALMALIENLQRQDLNFFEQAEGFRALTEQYGMTQQQAAVSLGIAQPTIANKLRLLRLSEEQRDMILNFGLTERHARALLRVEEEKRTEILQTGCEKHFSAEAFEKYVDEFIKQEKLKANYRKRASVLSDVRLFFNTVEKALNVMRLAGVDAVSEKKNQDGYIEYVIKIPGNTK